MDEFLAPIILPLEEEPLEQFITLEDKTFQLNSMRDLMDHFRFNLGEKKVAIAKFGGTLAVCRDVSRTEFFELSDPLRDHICFYSNHGLFQNKIRFDNNIRIVGFDFLFDEQLVVVLETGEYFIIDPFESNSTDDETNSIRISQYNFGRNFKEDSIVEAKIFRNGLVFQTKSNKFYFKTHLIESQLEEFKHNNEMGSEKLCWAIITPEYGQFELQVANPSSLGGGILCLSEDQTRSHVQYNGIDPLFFDDTVTVNLKNVKSIASSENGEWIAYLTFEENSSVYTTHIISTNIDDECYRKIKLPTIPTSSTSITTPQMTSSTKSIIIEPKMYWVQNYCLAIKISEQLILVGKETSTIVNEEFNFDPKTQKRTPFVCSQETDCVKIVTQNKILLLRHTPPAYLNIFYPKDSSEIKSPARRLYDESIQRKERMDFSSDDDIRNSPDELREAINQCIVAGSYELKRARQNSLLKAASFGRIFAHGHQNNASHMGVGDSLSENDGSGSADLTTVCKFLRVCFQLNNQKYSRTLTFSQVSNLEENHPDVLVKLMLRYNYHYIAMQIVNFLHLSDRFKSMIYVHWARCKIEKNDSDASISSAIQKKLQGEPNISFTDIAHKALSHGKPQIALKLLEYEPCIQRRIPVLLWMAKYLRESKEKYFQIALNEALSSKDSSLVYLVIRTIWEDEEEKGEKCFKYFAKEEVLSMHFIKFLRSIDSQNDKQLYSYLISQKQSMKAGFFLLEKIERVKLQSELIQLMEEVKKEFIKETKDRFYFFQIDEYIKLLKNCDQSQIGGQQEGRKNSIPNSSVGPNQVKNGIQSLSSSKSTKELSVSSHLTYLFSQKQDIAITKLQTDLKLSEKRLNFCKLKAIIEATPSDQNLIEQTIDQINRKSIDIPYEMIVDTLLRKGGLETLAMRMANRITNPDKNDLYLKKVAEAFGGKKNL